MRTESTYQDKFLLQSTSNLGAVVGVEQGAIGSISGNEGRNAPSRGECLLGVFSVYFWHSEGWTPRNEALLEGSSDASKNYQTAVVDSGVMQTCVWKILRRACFQSNLMHVVAPKKRPRADLKVRKENGLKEPMTTSLRVAASEEKITDEGGGGL